MGLGGLIFGHKPDYGYTDEQSEIMDWGNNYGEQYAPTYEGDRRMMKRYNKGDDRKGKLTRFLLPLRQMLAGQKQSAQMKYNEAMAPGFNSGGGALAAAGQARIGREYDKDAAGTLAGAYVQRGEQLHDRVTSQYEAAKGRELAARGISAGVANRPQDYTREGGLLGKGGIIEGLMKQGIRGGLSMIPGVGPALAAATGGGGGSLGYDSGGGGGGMSPSDYAYDPYGAGGGGGDYLQYTDPSNYEDEYGQYGGAGYYG